MLVLRRMTGQDMELPRRVGPTFCVWTLTGKSAFITADLTLPKTVCVCVYGGGVTLPGMSPIAKKNRQASSGVGQLGTLQQPLQETQRM